MQTALYIPSLIADIQGLQAALDANEALANTKATPGYVDAAVAALVDSSPAALDTLNELAAALGDDANFATTVTDALASKLTQTQADALYKPIGYVPAWGEITGIPTTLAGYGVTADADLRYLQLSGGTLTGALNGTSAEFSGNVYSAGRGSFGQVYTGNDTTLLVVPLATNDLGIEIISTSSQTANQIQARRFSVGGQGSIFTGYTGSATNDSTQAAALYKPSSAPLANYQAIRVEPYNSTTPVFSVSGTGIVSLSSNLALSTTSILFWGDGNTSIRYVGAESNISTRVWNGRWSWLNSQTNVHAARLYVSGRLDLEGTTPELRIDGTQGIVVKSADGTYWRITVDNAGALTTTNLGSTLPA